MDPDLAKQQFLEQLGRPWMAEEIFDAVSDCVYFVKDEMGRYIAANRALVERCGKSSKADIIGRTARDLFPPPLGENFSEQDLEVIRLGRAIRAQLELHIYPEGKRGWCLTWKEPVLDSKGETVGVSGISRDIPSQTANQRDFGALAAVLDHIDENLGEPLKLEDLAATAELSSYQLDQRIRTLFDLSTSQYVTRKRIELACHLLERSSDSIGFIALDCGYGDQSAFTRQFRQSVGIAPGAYRDQNKLMSGRD